MGYGAQWEACFGERNIIDVVQAVVERGHLADTLAGNREEGGTTGDEVRYFALEYGDLPLRCMAIIEKDPGEGTLTLSVAYPFLRDGIPVPLRISQVRADEEWPEATLECTTREGVEISLFEPVYACNKDLYRTGEAYEFSLAALAYFLEPVPETTLLITEGPMIEMERHRRLEEDPGADVSTINSVEVSVKDLRGAIRQDNGMDMEFQTVVDDVSFFTFEGTEFCRMRVVLMRPFDEDVEIFLYASEHVLKNYRPQVDDSIRGILWLQGYPLKHIDGGASWDTVPAGSDYDNLARAMASEEYFSDLHVGASALCRSLVYMGWDVTRYANPENSPDIPTVRIEREGRQADLWIRSFIEGEEPEVSFTTMETERYISETREYGREAAWAVVSCTDIGSGHTFRCLQCDSLEALTGEVRMTQYRRKERPETDAV